MLIPAELPTDPGLQVPRTEDFDAFVATRGHALVRLALVLTGGLPDAEDVVQDVLAKALPRWRKISAMADPEAYLRRMVVNTHISSWRRFRRHETPVEAVLSSENATDSADTVLNSDENRRLWSAVLSLTPTQRVAVALRFHEGLSYAEIADLTGTREATARSHVFRGLERLRSVLKGEL